MPTAIDTGIGRRQKFDWALIFLSTLTGAALIVQMTSFNPGVEIILISALVIAGAAFQATSLLGERRVSDSAR